MGISLDIGIFAHNEAGGIDRTLQDLARQTVFADPALDVRVLILANGCSDDTAGVSVRQIEQMAPAVASRFVVHDLPQGGKSRTANRFIHDLSRQDADMLAFMDADIELPAPDSLARMVTHLLDNEQLHVINSRPVKDVTHHNLPVGPVARLIAMGGGGLTDYRTSICGQLYLIRGAIVRRIHLPVGLPVEDGFMKAMVMTDLFTRPLGVQRIDGLPEAFHVYESVRTIGELLRHQTRIVVGTAVNSAIYRRMDERGHSVEQAQAFLGEIAAQDDWLDNVLAEDLPRFPFGYVPFSLLSKRLGRRPRSLRAALAMVFGLGLDVVAYVRASWLMMRRSGAHFW